MRGHRQGRAETSIARHGSVVESVSARGEEEESGLRGKKKGGDDRVSVGAMIDRTTTRPCCSGRGSRATERERCVRVVLESPRERETYTQRQRQRGRERGVRHMRVVTPNKNARYPRPARARVPLSLSPSFSPCSSTVNNNNNSTRAARGCSGSLQNTESGVLPNCSRNLSCPLTHAPLLLHRRLSLSLSLLSR